MGGQVDSHRHPSTKGASFLLQKMYLLWETWSNMVFPTKGRLIFTVKFQKIDPAKLSGTRCLSRNMNMTFKTFSFSSKVDWLSEI